MPSNLFDLVEVAPASGEPSARMGVIYALSDPANAVYRYIGQTVRSAAVRLRGHIEEARRGRVGHHGNWIRSIVRAGGVPRVIVLERVPEAKLDEAERAWISACRTAGIVLTNRTDGGAGNRGIRLTAETRAKMSASAVLRSTPEWRARKSRCEKARAQTPEGRARLTEISRAAHDIKSRAMTERNPMKGRTHSEAAREKMSAANRQRWQDPAFREKMQLRVPVRHTAITREKMSAAKLAFWTPAQRARQSASLLATNPMRGRKHTQETLERMAAASRALWADPEYREKMAHRGGA